MKFLWRLDLWLLKGRKKRRKNRKRKIRHVRTLAKGPWLRSRDRNPDRSLRIRRSMSSYRRAKRCMFLLRRDNAPVTVMAAFTTLGDGIIPSAGLEQAARYCKWPCCGGERGRLRGGGGRGAGSLRSLPSSAGRPCSGQRCNYVLYILWQGLTEGSSPN